MNTMKRNPENEALNYAAPNQQKRGFILRPSPETTTTKPQRAEAVEVHVGLFYRNPVLELVSLQLLEKGKAVASITWTDGNVTQRLIPERFNPAAVFRLFRIHRRRMGCKGLSA